MALAESQTFDAALIDLNYEKGRTGGEQGLDLINALLDRSPALPVIVMTAWSSIDLALEAMRRGAKDFIEKPWDEGRLVTMLRGQAELGRALRRVETLERENTLLKQQADVSGEIGSQSETRTTTFTFDGKRFVKQVRVDGREWKFNIAIASHDDLDLEVPSGLFAYLPTALSCLGVRGEAGRPSRCAGGDPAFANPGLLSLALPLMWEEKVNKKKFLFFTPAGVGTMPGGLMDMNRLMRQERDQLSNFTRYYDKVDLDIKEFVEGAQIGPRKRDAWMLDGSGAMREVYTDTDGTVLKVNLDPHPVTHGERWIRLLFPSEY